MGALVTGLLLSLIAAAVAAEPGTLVITNVSAAGSIGSATNQIVNLYVTDGRLVRITPHVAGGKPVDASFNANAWTVLGALQLNEPASFIILRGDARSNFDLLRDSRANAAFVIESGEVLRNELGPGKPALPAVAAASVSQEDEGPWHSWQTENTSNLFVIGIILDRVDWVSQNSASKARLGDLSPFDGGEIRDFRFGATGKLGYFERPWTYTFFVATNAFDKEYDVKEQEDLSIYDLRLDIPTSDNTHLAIGKQKEPISGDRMQSAIFNHMQERAAVSDALLRSRNTGVTWYGYDPETYFTWGAGVFNDWLDDNDSDSNAETTVAGRVTWAPLVDEAKRELLHLGIGHRWSDVSRGVRYASGPELYIAPQFVDTGFGREDPRFAADSASTWNAEIGWRRGPLWIGSEYTRTEVDSREFGDPGFDGYWVAASWIVGGGARPYDRRKGLFGAVPITQPVDRGGRGTLEFSGRWSTVDLDDSLVQGGDMDIASVGVAWWLTPNLGVDLDFRYTWTSFLGESEKAGAFNSRILLLLE
ncbi:MAG: hypothetical protein Hals2KO_12800 [Halioglobus sp.]